MVGRLDTEVVNMVVSCSEGLEFKSLVAWPAKLDVTYYNVANCSPRFNIKDPVQCFQSRL